MADTDRLPEFPDILAAAARLKGHIVETPLLNAPLLDARLGARLLVKAEVLQHTGSFKYRGAWNAVAALTPEARAKGLLAFSSGNHAQAVAAVARQAGIPATVVMPLDAPAVKTGNVRRMGARIVTYDRQTDDREAIAEQLRQESGAALIKPYDALQTIAGQGTIGLEIAAQCRAAGVTPDLLLCPCGGGGLVTGVALAVAALLPQTAVHAVEPEGFDDMRLSLETGMAQRNRPGADSFCDALLTPEPGRIPLALGRSLLAGSIVVPDAYTAQAMRCAFADFRLVAEPGGAIALGAALGGRIDIRGKTVVVVLSGGNVEHALFQRILLERPSP